MRSTSLSRRSTSNRSRRSVRTRSKSRSSLRNRSSAPRRGRPRRRSCSTPLRSRSPSSGRSSRRRPLPRRGSTPERSGRAGRSSRNSSSGRRRSSPQKKRRSSSPISHRRIEKASRPSVSQSSSTTTTSRPLRSPPSPSPSSSSTAESEKTTASEEARMFYPRFDIEYAEYFSEVLSLRTNGTATWNHTHGINDFFEDSGSDDEEAKAPNDQEVENNKVRPPRGSLSDSPMPQMDFIPYVSPATTFQLRSTLLQGSSTEKRIVLYNQYLFHSVIGKGTFSKVVKVVCLRSKRWRAIKVFRGLKRYAEACEDEIRVLNALRLAAHSTGIESLPHLDYTEVFTVPPHYAIVYPLCGPSLYDVLKQNGSQCFSMDDVRSISYQLLSFIALCHAAGIVHTDLKPENVLFESPVLLQSNDSKLIKPLHTCVKVIDFSNAEFLQELRADQIKRKEQRRRPSTIQTRHYRAPEVVLRVGWSEAADLWSVGCMLPELLTGQCLFMTHSDEEHVALMEKTLGLFDRELIRTHWHTKSSPCTGPSLDDVSALFSGTECRSRWGLSEAHSTADAQKLKRQQPLEIVCQGEKYPEFGDLVKQLLQQDPAKRISADAALKHKFFTAF